MSMGESGLCLLTYRIAGGNLRHASLLNPTLFEGL